MVADVGERALTPHLRRAHGAQDLAAVSQWERETIGKRTAGAIA